MVEMQEETMKDRNLTLKCMGAGAAVTLAFTLGVPPAPAQTMTDPPAAPPTAVTPVKKKPTSATPQMIDEASQRSQARTAKQNATGVPEQFGSEEPFTYVPGKTTF
jgi:hypothetical protein